MHGRVSCLGFTIIGAALLIACGGSNEGSSQAAYPMTNNAQQPGTNTGYSTTGQQQPVQQTQPGYAQQPVQPQPVQPQPTQPQPTQPQPAPTAPAAVQELDASMAAPVKPLLKQLVGAQVPAGAKEMALIVANFPAPGGKLQKQIQVTNNKCYTIVAVGAPGVTEVNLSLVSPIPLVGAIAIDKMSGAQAVLGAKPDCYKHIAFSGPMNLVVDVPAGQGLVAIQVYEK